MPLGGGTFQTYDKEIPGVYINISYQQQTLEGVTSGIVGCIVETKTEVKEAILTNKGDYVSKLKGFFKMEDEEEDYKTFCTYLSEIYLNASYVYLIPYPIGGNDKTTLGENDLESKVWGMAIHSLVAIDRFGTCFANSDNKIPLIACMDGILNKSSSRFPMLIGSDYLKEGSPNVDLLNALKNLDLSLVKWIQTPYFKTDADYKNVKPYLTSIFFLAGVLSQKMEGQSIAGTPYTGSLDSSYWIPGSTDEQTNALKKGQLCFYTLGNLTTPYLLKDITLASWEEQANFKNATMNEKSGPIVRIERFFYDFFSRLFQSTIQGKPNSPTRRALIRARIYDELNRLHTLDVIEECKEGDVTVEQVDKDKNKDKIKVFIQYKPTYGIDYVYINVVVS